MVEMYVAVDEKEKERKVGWTRRSVRVAGGESKRKTRVEKRRGQSRARTMERKCSHPE